MKLRWFSHLLILLALVVSLLGLAWVFHAQQPQPIANASRVVQAYHPSKQAASGTTLLTPQVVVGTPEAVGTPRPPARYTYINDFPADRTQWQPLYLLDTQTGQQTRLGDDSGPAIFDAQSADYLLWYFGCGLNCRTLPAGLYAYSFTTGQNIFISQFGAGMINSQIAGDWVAFGAYRPRNPQAPLFAANLQTHETITLTQDLNTQLSTGNGNFGISPRLAVWFTFAYPAPSEIVIYDLTTHTIVKKLSDFQEAFNTHAMTIYNLTPGETVVTWSDSYGYDLVTGSYFRIPALYPPNWNHHTIVNISRMTEKERILSWTFDMKDGTQWQIQAPLIDASPSAAPCIEGQNLIQNGDLEDIATHNVWQQSGNPSALIVNDLPPNSPQAGQWAIRLGRYSNSQPTIQQRLSIPSGVKHISLAFDVRASSWDIWGGDQLQVDLIDPVTNHSILATPVQWTNRQLASGGWIPMQVDIQDWPGIDTPLQLVFRAQTDWAFPTDFTVDNIRFITSCT